MQQQQSPIFGAAYAFAVAPGAIVVLSHDWLRGYGWTAAQIDAQDLLWRETGHKGRIQLYDTQQEAADDLDRLTREGGGVEVFTLQGDTDAARFAGTGWPMQYPVSSEIPNEVSAVAAQEVLKRIFPRLPCVGADEILEAWNAHEPWIVEALSVDLDHPGWPYVNAEDLQQPEFGLPGPIVDLLYELEEAGWLGEALKASIMMGYTQNLINPVPWGAAYKIDLDSSYFEEPVLIEDAVHIQSWPNVLNSGSAMAVLRRLIQETGESRVAYLTWAEIKDAIKGAEIPVRVSLRVILWLDDLTLHRAAERFPSVKEAVRVADDAGLLTL